MFRILILCGLMVTTLSACQTTRTAAECNEDFVNEVVAGPYCMEIKVKRSREKFEDQPRAYFLFPGDGNSYKNFSYWDGLYNRLSQKPKFGNADILLITVKYPSQNEWVNLGAHKEDRILAMNIGIEKIIAKYQPSHIEFWGQSGGGMRAIYSAGLSSNLPINKIVTFASPCDIRPYVYKQVKSENVNGLMNPIEHLLHINKTTVFSFFGAKNDTNVNFYESNIECKKLLEDNRYALDYFHEFNGIGHGNLKDSAEYLDFNYTIIDPDYQPNIPRNMSKEEVAHRLEAAGLEVSKTQ